MEFWWREESDLHHADSKQQLQEDDAEEETERGGVRRELQEDDAEEETERGGRDLQESENTGQLEMRNTCPKLFLQIFCSQPTCTVRIS